VREGRLRWGVSFDEVIVNAVRFAHMRVDGVELVDGGGGVQTCF